MIRRAAIALVSGTLLGFVATMASAEAPTDRLDWELLEARGAAERGEPQIAESHHRAAAREAWLLLGRLAILDQDLDAAHAALTRARNAAAVDFETARELLALVELHRAGIDGEVEPALRELRFGAHERPDDAALLARFAQALWATGRDEELAAELDVLRRLDPPSAARFEASTRETDRQLPALDAGPMDSMAEEERSALAQRLRDLVGSLDVHLQDVEVQDTEGAPSTGTVHTVEVGPFVVDPARRLAVTPTSLHGVLDQLDGGDRDGAVASLREHLGGPDEAAARALLGRLLAEAGEIEAAESMLIHAIRISPEPLDAQLALARLAWLQGRRVEAITTLRQAVFGGEPLERDLAFVLADAEIAQQRWDVAREQLEALHKGHDSALAMVRLVAAMTEAGDEKQAFDAAERALALAPNSEEVLRVHVRLALDVGTAHRAARSVEALARMRPDVAEYQLFLGETWSQRRKMGEASEAYLRAVTLDPDLVEARKPLGLALNHESRFAEGREHLERFLASDPDDLDALAGLAEAEERLGEPEAAEARARGVLEIEPSHARANLVLGMIRSGRGEFEPARRSLERAVQIDPWLAKAHYQLSFACARTGDRDCARRHLELYERALEGPESSFVQLEAASPKPAETMMMRSEGGS